MKTIKELEKEIADRRNKAIDFLMLKRNEKDGDDAVQELLNEWAFHEHNLAKLEQTEQICEMIEESIDDITGFKLNDWTEDDDIEIKQRTLNLILKEELLSKIKCRIR